MRYSALMHDTDAGLKAQENRRGIVAMLLAMALFLANDTLVKLVSASLPTGQLIFLRGVMACLWLLGLCAHRGLLSQWRTLQDRAIWVRGVTDASASLIYLTALFHLPLANATAINLASPLFILVLAVLFFGERLAWGRTLAALVGFGGVLLVIRPSADGFNAYAGLCVLGTVMHAGRDVLTRRIGPTVPGLLITLATAACVTVMSGLWSLTEPWVGVSAMAWIWLLMASVCLAGAYHLIIVAMRHGEMGVIAPFRYSALLYAVVLGYLIWDEVPDGLTWLGIALLVSAGLSLIWSNRK
ncbi:MAG: Riboflavin transporter [Pseudomonadota bacterium]|jgi:drug/metabolite transporter (DMT)-like permease